MSNTDRSIISFGSVREAAVYFPGVIPLGVVSEALQDDVARQVADSKFSPNNLIRTLLPPQFSKNDEFVEAVWAINKESLLDRLHHQTLVWSDDQFNAVYGDTARKFGFSRSDTAKAALLEQKRTRKLLRDYKLSSVATDRISDHLSDNDGERDVIFQIASLKLLDVQNTKWEQIIEFRNDKVAQEKLRKFRLFALQNYSGKSKSFVEDSILSQLSDYHEQIKVWGFETRLGTLATAISSKTFGAAMAGSFVSLLADKPAASILAAGSGVVVEVGKIGVEVVRRRLGLRKIMRENPVSFFDYANKKLSPPGAPDQGLS
jgi:hypothetical protein